MSRDFETLSAFLDGETSELETRRVMRDIDDTKMATLSRWQLARDVMHGHASAAVPSGFNDALSAALAEEDKPASRPAWLGGMARLAVAASVAAATVVGWQAWDSSQSANDAVPALASSQESRMVSPIKPSLVSYGNNQTESSSLSSLEEQDRGRVNAILLRHSDFAARHGGQSMMPFARLVSMDARQGAQ